MKTLCLLVIVLTLALSGFSQSGKGTTVIKETTYPGWMIPVYCDGIEIGMLVGDVTVKAIIHNNKVLQLDIVTGKLASIGDLEEENFEIKFHGKYHNYWWEPNFEVELHFIAKGDKGTKIINRGYFSPATGPVSLKSKCM